MKPIFRKMILISGLILLFQITGYAQTNTEAGIRLYQEGKYTEAAQILKNAAKKDPAAAYYLGLSYEKLGQIKEAIAVYEKAIDNVIYQISQSLIKKYRNARRKEEIDSGEYIRNAIGKNIDPAFESSMRLKEIDPRTNRAEDRETKNLVLNMYRADTVKKDPADELTPLIIIWKPQPSYTEEARKENFSGGMKVLVFFLANGKIGPVYPLSELSYGLTESSIHAARAINFKPAAKNKQNITVIKVVEYTFSLF